MTYTLVGNRDYVFEEINRLQRSFCDENIVSYDLEDVSMDRVIEDLNTTSLFGDKFIKVTGFEKMEDASSLIKYLDHESSNILILVSFKELDSRKKITKILKEKTKYKELFNYDLSSFVKERLDDYKMNAMAINVLINNCGTNIKRVENELEKLKLYKFKEKEITALDVEKLVKKGFDATIFNLIDVINARDKSKIFKIYHELLEEGETEEKILYTIANHYRLLFQVKVNSLIMSDSELIKEYKLHPFRLTKLKQQGSFVSKKEILEILKGLSDIDIAIKSGKKDISTSMVMFFENI